MQEIAVYDLDGNTLTNLVQYDTDVYVYIKDSRIAEAYQVHFFNSVSEKALVMDSSYGSGTLSVKVPNNLLEQPYTITGYVNVKKSGENKSLYGFRIAVRSRPIPDDWVHVDSKDYVTFDEIVQECRNYADNASESATEAERHESEAAEYAESASLSEIVAKASAAAAESAKESAEENANTVSIKTNEVSGYAGRAETAAASAETWAKTSQSYAIGKGGIRDDEESENAKTFYEKTRAVADSITSALKPKGNITFNDLMALESPAAGDFYNVTDEFESTGDFTDGGGSRYPSGTDVFYTSDRKWNAVQGAGVAGVKGENESNYRNGLVNITADNLGLGSVKQELEKKLYCLTEKDLGLTGDALTNMTLDTIVKKLKAQTEQRVSFCTFANTGNQKLFDEIKEKTGTVGNGFLRATKMPSRYGNGEVTILFEYFVYDTCKVYYWNWTDINSKGYSKVKTNVSDKNDTFYGGNYHGNIDEIKGQNKIYWCNTSFTEEQGGATVGTIPGDWMYFYLLNFFTSDGGVGTQIAICAITNNNGLIAVRDWCNGKWYKWQIFGALSNEFTPSASGSKNLGASEYALRAHANQQASSTERGHVQLSVSIHPAIPYPPAAGMYAADANAVYNALKKIQTDMSAHAKSSDVHVTSSEKDTWNRKLDTTSDTKSNKITFTSNDTGKEEYNHDWTSVTTLSSGETHASIMNKVSTMFNNLRTAWARIKKLEGNANYIASNKYVRIGRIVVVDFIFITSKSYSPNTDLGIALPAAVTDYAFLQLAVPYHGFIGTAYVHAGKLYASNSLETDQSVYINGVYLANSEYI